MTWTSPWAWALAAAVTLPIAAHLWSRHQPRSVPFPTLRFLQATSPIALRLRTLRDWPLLAWRVLIVLAVTAAAAGPTIASLARSTATAPLHRVIVVDEAVRAQASALVEQLRGETAAVVVDDRPVASALGDAMALAATSARRTRSELVVVWDGSRPALLPRDLEPVPAYVGVRLAPLAASTPAPGEVASAAALVDAIELPRDADALRAPLVAALATVRVPDPQARVRLRWRSTPLPDPERAPTTAPGARLVRALDDLAADVRLRGAADRSRPLSRPSGAGTGVSRGRIHPLLDGHVADDGLVIDSLAVPDAPLTWWAAIAPVEALVRWERLSTSGERWTESAVRSAMRAPAAAEVEGGPSGRHTREAWLLVLALLLVEQVWRSRLREARVRDDA